MKRSLASLAAIVFLTAAPALAATEISVTGTGSVTMPPDEATIAASITTIDPNAQSATSRNNQTYEAVTRALAAQGIAPHDVTLSYYNVNYQPKPQAGPVVPVPSVYGYTVTRSFAVKVHDISKAGSVVDAITPSKGVEINGVSFGLADSSVARSQATGKAVADARAKAEALARAAGLRITAIQRLSLESAGYPTPMPMMRLNAEAASAPVPTAFDPGNVNVTVNVGVIFSASP